MCEVESVVSVPQQQQQQPQTNPSPNPPLTPAARPSASCGDSQGNSFLPETISRMTRILVDDKTKPNNSNVKVAQSLSRCGMNIRLWVSYVISAAIQKDCSEAFQGPLPGTRANAAALSLLTESTPADWGPDLVTFPSAYEALVWITQKFQGGHNREVNREWLRQLQTVKMDREQTLEQYLSAKWTLYSNLVGNNSTIDERDLHKAVVDCLAVELATGSSGLYSQCVGKSRD